MVSFTFYPSSQSQTQAVIFDNGSTWRSFCCFHAVMYYLMYRRELITETAIFNRIRILIIYEIALFHRETTAGDVVIPTSNAEEKEK